MFRKSWLSAIGVVVLMASSALAGTFGTVVPIGGAASDLALDEARGVLYIANFTANRIEVMSLLTRQIQTSINVAAQPSSISLSRDGHWLLVAHYGNNTAPASPTNGLTLIDLTAKNSKQTFALGNPPLGVAFGVDNRALVVTTKEFFTFDPTIGSTRLIQTIANLTPKTLPQPAQSFPPNIVSASVGASADGTQIWGFGDNVVFRYDVYSQGVYGGLYTSSPPLGPRSVGVAADGSFAAMGWVIYDSDFNNIAEFANPSGILNVGSLAVDSSRNLIYGQVQTTADSTNTTASKSPILEVRDSDNLTLRERYQLRENLAGKSVISSDNNTMYSISDSGVTIFPIGTLNTVPRIVTSAEDLVFRGNFCDRRVATKTLVITDPGGRNTPFSIASSSAGVRVSPSSGVTPATVQVQVDPNAFQDQKGTAQVTLTITSSTGVNLPKPVRVLVNSREPEQRGTFIDIPGTLVDIAADPQRNRYYVLRQDQNQVLVFDSTNNAQIATLRTCTKPMSMAITFDGQSLLVGCDNAQIIPVFALDTLQAQLPISAPSSYVQSIATSAKATLAVMRDGGGGDPNIQRIDLTTRQSTKPTSLGVYENKVPLNTVLASSPNGSTILAASSDGSVMLYDANVDSFTVSRKDFEALGGAYAASAFNQYVVGNNLLNSSLVPVATFDSSLGLSSGFAFIDFGGVASGAANSSSAGVITYVDLSNGSSIRPTRMVEAPILGNTAQAFTRTVAPLASRDFIVNLTTSGVTVLPWAYDTSVVPPVVAAVVSAADGTSPAAPGGLISIYGSNLSPTNLATSEIPVPTALGDSCLTVNGQPLPLIFVSPNQINAQMPFQALGNVTLIVHTPGGVSDNFYLTVLPNAPAIFLSGQAGPVTNLPTVVRAENGLATDSNPVHRGDMLIIYLTGLGLTNPLVANGTPAPVSPLAVTLTPPVLKLGGTTLPLLYSGLAPGQVGVYQINVNVPKSTPTGLGVPLTITQGTFTGTVKLRVVE